MYILLKGWLWKNQRVEQNPSLEWKGWQHQLLKMEFSLLLNKATT